MPNARLIATYKGERRQSNFYASDSLDATFSGIQKVLNKAVKSQIWARGRIRLFFNGQMIREMESKG